MIADAAFRAQCGERADFLSDLRFARFAKDADFRTLIRQIRKVAR